jgi:hypothetical protein
VTLDLVEGPALGMLFLFLLIIHTVLVLLEYQEFPYDSIRFLIAFHISVDSYAWTQCNGIEDSWFVHGKIMFVQVLDGIQSERAIKSIRYPNRRPNPDAADTKQNVSITRGLQSVVRGANSPE